MTNEIRDEADIDTFVQRFQEPEHAGDVPDLRPSRESNWRISRSEWRR